MVMKSVQAWGEHLGPGLGVNAKLLRFNIGDAGADELDQLGA